MLFAWPAQRDELREIFNDISSSSEDEEDDGDRHEDEDLNIMDTEDDLVRQLQDKLNESDSAQTESDRNTQIGEICFYMQNLLTLMFSLLKICGFAAHVLYVWSCSFYTLWNTWKVTW